MEPQNSQVNIEMTPEESKAALGNATFLQEQLLGQMNPSVEGEIAPEDGAITQGENIPEQAPEAPTDTPNDTGMEDRIMEEIQNLREEIQENSTKKELESIKKELKDLLNDESNDQ